MRLFYATLLFSTLTACKQEPEPFEFENHEFESELDTLQPVLEDLLWPSDMIVDETGLTLIERDAMTIHTLADDSIQDSWEWGETPLQLLTTNDDTWVRTESGIHSVDGSGESVEATDIAHMFTLGGDLHWVTSSETGHIDNGTGTLLSTEHPIDTTVVVGDTLFLLDRATKVLYRVSEEGTSEAHRFSDEPRLLIADGNTLYATTRSARWPYGGWILKLEGSVDSWTETRLSDSPPEAERLLVHDDFVYWGSKQSITRVSTDGGTYEMIAQNTTVGAMVIHDGTLWWTDSKGGRLFALPL